MSESVCDIPPRLMTLHETLLQQFLRANEYLWRRLPSSVHATRMLCAYGRFLHSLIRARTPQKQYHGTFFFRNRPELDLIRMLVNRLPKESTLRLTVLACSNGAEVYSILWTLRSARPDLRLITHAIDISGEVLEIGQRGIYSLTRTELVNTLLCDRMTEREMEAIFDREGSELRIKSWLKEGIKWQVADAADPELVKLLRGQDIVVANNFLCHMGPTGAESCLRNLAGLVRPGGHLFVSGVDLDIRTKVAVELGWIAVVDLIEEMHDGDPSVRRDWPWAYWGLEPFNKKRPDWNIRYASAFEIEHEVESRSATCVLGLTALPEVNQVR